MPTSTTPAAQTDRFPLSVLDLSTVGEGSTPAQALQHTVELAQHVERLGYERFWLAEHHNMPGIASSAPTILIGRVAAATERIRVGSGGVMLPNHPPLVVAEQFGTLEALFPGRIDLGIGRAPGTDPTTAHALRRSATPLSADDFPRQLLDLFGFFRGNFRDDHPYRSIRAVPGEGYEPPVWLLGSSDYSAQAAALLGLPFAFAHHFSAASTVPALDLYRELFRPSPELAEPYAMIAVQVIVGDDDEHARWLAGPSALSFLRLRQGNPGRLPTSEDAAAYPYSALERAAIDERLSQQAIGGPETVRARLAELVAQTGADEIMATAMVHSQADRLRSYELLASDVVRPPARARAGADTSG